MMDAVLGAAAGLPRARLAAYLLFAAIAVAAVALGTGPLLLAGLFSYMILDLTDRWLAPRLPEGMSRWLALGIFLVTAAGLSWLFGLFIKQTLARTPEILNSVLPQVETLAKRLGVELPFEDMRGMREAVAAFLMDNVRIVTTVSGRMSKVVLLVLAGIVIAVLRFMAGAEPCAASDPYEELCREFNARARLYMSGFEKILGAQVIIALINTVLTLIFLSAVGMPYIPFLALATFVFGILPIIGNLISNTIIVGTALTISPHLALMTLTFLVVIHKGEYFLNSRIVGGSLRTPMWQTLIAIVLGELIMGVAGVILAPTVLYYVREEIRSTRADRA
ncbi:MAG: AI-2E family transporter [Elusimicrobia bacterium]|nr:AI-2E family transporter [Elusimicrobiota bacterium]